MKHGRKLKKQLTRKSSRKDQLKWVRKENDKLEDALLHVISKLLIIKSSNNLYIEKNKCLGTIIEQLEEKNRMLKLELEKVRTPWYKRISK